MDMPIVFGYARVSSDPQETSIDRQTEGITLAADQLPGVFDGVRAEIQSASEFRYHERPVFKELMGEMRRGDKLIVECYDRLDRHPNAQSACIDFLHRAGVELYFYDPAGGPPKRHDYNDFRSQVDSMVNAIGSAVFIDQLKRKTRDALKFRKRNGFAHSRCIAHGKRRTEVSVGGKRYFQDVWDETQLDIMREIVARKDAGESWSSIACDFVLRGLTTNNWNAKERRFVPWAKYYRRDGSGGWYTSTIILGYRAYKQAVARGEQPPVPPLAITGCYWSRDRAVPQTPEDDSDRIGREALELLQSLGEKAVDAKRKVMAAMSGQTFTTPEEVIAAVYRSDQATGASV